MGDSTERDNWNWETFQGQCGNLVQWKQPGIYNGELSKDFYLVLGNAEPEPLIFYNQARLPAVRLEHKPSHKI